MNSWDAAKELNWKFLIEKEKTLVDRYYVSMNFNFHTPPPGPPDDGCTEADEKEL